MNTSGNFLLLRSVGTYRSARLTFEGYKNITFATKDRGYELLVNKLSATNHEALQEKIAQVAKRCM
jgi:hypothetical protein